MTTPVFRFAPSPNGYLHLGHALSALINFGTARAAGGRFLLRIEDIDAARCRPHSEAAIYEDLAWLGMTWEEPVRRQSAHLDDYHAALARLNTLVYPSFESRGEIARLVAEREMHAPWPRDPDGAPLYPGDARSLSAAERRRRMEAGEPYALRLDMAAALARTGATTIAGPPMARPAGRIPMCCPISDGRNPGRGAKASIGADTVRWPRASRDTKIRSSMPISKRPSKPVIPTMTTTTRRSRTALAACR